MYTANAITCLMNTYTLTHKLIKIVILYKTVESSRNINHRATFLDSQILYLKLNPYIEQLFIRIDRKHIKTFKDVCKIISWLEYIRYHWSELSEI